MSRPFTPRQGPPQPQFRINGKIRAREVRVLQADGQLVGIMELGAAINLARTQGLDLVEISANADPPVCKIVDFGKFKYEHNKRERESKKGHHAHTVKEVQLSPRIDPHDLGIKLDHAVGFLCEDHKVKVSLRFRAREMARTQIGQAVMEKFLKDLGPWGQADFAPKLIGRSINVMISPLPKNKRAKNPKETGEAASKLHENDIPAQVAAVVAARPPVRVPIDAAEQPGNFGNNPFNKLSLPGETPPGGPVGNP